LANVHGNPKPETAYQFKILKAVILQNDSAHCLDSVGIRQTWPDKASERLLDKLLEDESFYEAFFASER
jgi:hypothetical protein